MVMLSGSVRFSKLKNCSAFFYAALGERCGLLLFVDDIIVILVDLVIVFLFVRLRHADGAQGLCEAVGDVVSSVDCSPWPE